MTDITFDSSSLDWDKLQGQAELAPASVSAFVPALVPAIVQHHLTGKVLMLGYMDKAALEKTLTTKQVTFFSRSKQRLWTKGETSGNTLELIAIDKDCDNDSLLVQVIPNGPTCHKGTISCWLDGKAHTFMDNLTHLIISRKGQDADSSYTASLFKAGTKRIAQKVGEEGLETALAAATHDKEELVNEASDLMYHLLVLLEDQDLSMELVTKNLMQRHLKTKA